MTTRPAGGIDFFDSTPQIVVLSGRDLAPATCKPIEIGSHTEVGTVYVGMGAIIVNLIALSETPRDKVAMFCERIHVHRPRNRPDSGFSEYQLFQEPIGRHFRIGVSMCEPVPIEWAAVALKRCFRCGRASLTHDAGLNAEDGSVRGK
jgi:hypothetical protein